MTDLLPDFPQFVQRSKRSGQAIVYQMDPPSLGLSQPTSLNCVVRTVVEPGDRSRQAVYARYVNYLYGYRRFFGDLAVLAALRIINRLTRKPSNLNPENLMCLTSIVMRSMAGSHLHFVRSQTVWRFRKY